ncbi:hypothetical protein D3C72_2253060 [compost metagenome]
MAKSSAVICDELPMPLLPYNGLRLLARRCSISSGTVLAGWSTRTTSALTNSATWAMGSSAVGMSMGSPRSVAGGSTLWPRPPVVRV